MERATEAAISALGWEDAPAELERGRRMSAREAAAYASSADPDPYGSELAQRVNLQVLALLVLPQRGGMPGEGVADLELVAAHARVIDFQRSAGRAARQAHDPHECHPWSQTKPAGLDARWRPGRDGLSPLDRTEAGFFHAVIDAARPGVAHSEDRQPSGKSSGYVRGSELGGPTCLRVSHDPVPDHGLIARSQAKLGGDVKRHRPPGNRRWPERTPVLSRLVEVIAKFIAVHQPGPRDRPAGRADTDHRAAPPDRFYQPLGRQLDNGTPHGLAPCVVRSHQLCFFRDGGPGRVVATGYCSAEGVSDVLPLGHGRTSSRLRSRYIRMY